MKTLAVQMVEDRIRLHEFAVKQAELEVAEATARLRKAKENLSDAWVEFDRISEHVRSTGQTPA